MKLSGHIYRAACQWRAYQADLDSLQPGHLTMVVDYQMNGTILHKDSTTSSHMGANTAQFCIYPAFLAMRLTDGRVVRGGIIFLSRDTKHDRHQVKVFHGLIKEQMQKKYGSEVAVITRWVINVPRNSSHSTQYMTSSSLTLAYGSTGISLRLEKGKTSVICLGPSLRLLT